MGPLVPLFWISGNISSGFQSQSGFCLIRYFCGGECNVHSPRFTSGATLADLLAAGTQPVTSPHACAEVGLGSDSNVQSHGQKTNALPLCQRPGFPHLNLVVWIFIRPNANHFSVEGLRFASVLVLKVIHSFRLNVHVSLRDGRHVVGYDGIAQPDYLSPGQRGLFFFTCHPLFFWKKNTKKNMSYFII